MPQKLTKLYQDESNPYRPDLPSDMKGFAPDLFNHMRESTEIQREQHNVTQAGDTTFSWEILTEIDIQPRYNVGSLGRFYHKEFGVIQARYCKFSRMRETEWLGAPLGLIGDADPLNWVVTNDFSISSPDSVIGIGGFYVLPPEGTYGWVIVSGVNIQGLGLRKRTPVKQGDRFVWSANDRVTTADDAEGKVLGKIVGEFDYELIPNEDGTGDYGLLTKADRTGTETFQRFQPMFWTANFPSTMIASLTTNGETLIVDCEFTREDDLCGVIWESADTWDHPLTAYDTDKDYSNCVLSFTIEITGQTLNLENTNGPVLTIEGKDGFGAPKIWYVRLVNYRTSGNATTAQIVLDFDNLAGGFAMDDPVNPTEIDRMFIGIVPTSYSTDTPGPLTTNEVCRVRLTNITVTGSNSVLVAGTGIGVNELRMTNGYDDTYNLTPERLVRNVWLLGYRKWFNHYVGMSHYFSWQWNAGESRFIARDLPNPLNAPCTIWHNDLAKRLKALDFTVIFSISYEMLNSFMPASWRQLDSVGLPALTGWAPPSSLFSPCNEAGMDYLNRVFVAFADILQANELPIHMQVGEPWWWIDFRDFKPYFYDSNTTAKWTSETGLPVPIMTTMVGEKTVEEIQFLNWLGDRLADSTAAKIQAVRDKYPDMVSYVLVYLPQILSGFAGTPNTPDAKRVNMPTGWARPAFDVLQLEDYDFVINNEPHLSEAGRLLAEERLGYPREEQQYFAGFVLFKDDEQIWEYTSNAIRQAWEFGVPEVFVWAYTQVMRDGYVNYLTSQLSFRQWEIPAGYAMIEPAADSEKRIKNWIDDKVKVVSEALPALEADVKELKGANGLEGLTVRVQAAETTNEELATLISRESENRSRALYVVDGRLTALEQSLAGGVAPETFLNLQGIVNSLQGDFNSYVGFNNKRVDQLQTQMASVLSFGNLNEEIQSLRDADNTLADRITNLRFWQLFDVPVPASVATPYAGLALKVPRVKPDESGLEWYSPLSLPAGGTANQILQKFSAVDGAATWSDLTAGIVQFTPGFGLVSTDVQSAINEVNQTAKAAATAERTFVGLTDTPPRYAGKAARNRFVDFAFGGRSWYTTPMRKPMEKWFFGGTESNKFLRVKESLDGVEFVELLAKLIKVEPTLVTPESNLQDFLEGVEAKLATIISTAVSQALQIAAINATPSVLIPSLSNSWINYGSGYGGCRYYKDHNGLVTIEGLIQAGVDGTLFTLLPGYRPADTLMFACWSGGGAYRVTVDSAGAVVLSGSNTVFSSLAGIQFYATN